MLIGGIVGGLTGYLLQYYVTVIYYPINIGGRPLHSWPAYIIITFEMTILFASLSAVFGLLGALRSARCRTIRCSMCRASRWPSRNRFFLCIESTDPLFDRDKTCEFLETLEPREVSEVAH